MDGIEGGGWLGMGLCKVMGGKRAVEVEISWWIKGWRVGSRMISRRSQKLAVAGLALRLQARNKSTLM